MLVICDASDGCNKEFEIEGFKVEKLDNSMEKTYFNCPQCNKVYIAFYTNESIRYKQQEIRSLQASYHDIKSGSGGSEGTFRKIKKLKAEIGRDMDRLKTKMKDTQ